MEIRIGHAIAGACRQSPLLTSSSMPSSCEEPPGAALTISMVLIRRLYSTSPAATSLMKPEKRFHAIKGG